MHNCITIRLTAKQAENLSDILNNTQDAGPPGQGWASGELSELRGLVDAAIQQANAEEIRLPLRPRNL